MSITAERRQELIKDHARQDGDTQGRVVAELGEDLAHDAAGCPVDGVGLRPVQGDDEDGTVDLDAHLGGLAHVRLPTAEASIG